MKISPVFNYNNIQTLNIKANPKTSPIVATHTASKLTFAPLNSTFLYSMPNVSFTGSKMISLQEQLEKVDYNAIPKRVRDRIQDELEHGTTKNLYEIHTETYAPLLSCQTLDEAKAMFPEFQDVIDAKDLEEDKMFLTMRKIKRGKFDNIKIEDLSLELLKSHYGRGLSPCHNKEAFFGFSKETVFNFLKAVNIERLDGQYLFLVSASSPQRRAKNSAAWTKEKRAVRSKQAIAEWDDEEKRKALSDKKKQYYIDHPEAAQAHSERMTGRVETPEHKAKISKGMKRYHKHHPEIAQLQQQAWFEHADIIQAMKKIAETEFPYLKSIFYKRANGIPLTQSDKNYETQYHKKCESMYPGLHATVAATYKRLRREYYAKNKPENITDITPKQKTDEV